MMDKFYQDIQEQLENRSEPPFDEGAWKDMQEKLAPYQEEKPSRKRFLWIFFLGGIIFFGGIGIWNWSSNKPSTSMEKTAGEVASLDSDKLPELAFGSNSEGTDEPEIAENIDKSISPSLEDLESNAKSLSTPVSQAFARTNTPKKIIPQNENYSENQLALSSPEDISLASDSRIPATTPLSIGLLDISEGAFHQPIADTAQKFFITQGPSPIIISPNRKNLQVGFIMGPQWILTPDIQTQLGIKASVFVRYPISPSFQVWGEFSGLRLWYKAPEETSSLGIPEWVPSSPDQTLTETRVNRIGMDYSGGISYLRPVGKRGDFYLGVGVGGRLWEPYSVIYGYTTENPGEEEAYEEDEEEIFEDLESEPFLQFRTGYTLQISPRLTWVIQANYQPGIPDDDDPFPAMFGIESGISLKLGMPRFRLKQKEK